MIVHLNGWPGAGKLTVGRSLARRLGGLLLDNHAILNVPAALAWGKGFATNAARAGLKDTFDRVGLHEVLAYTSADNVRSQAVMERLGLMRDERRDFVATYPDVGSWRGLVWFARRPGAVRPPLR